MLSDNHPSRTPNRMARKDYSVNGAYFLTICTKERHELLGSIQGGEMTLSENGTLAKSELEQLEKIYPSVLPECCVVMPNHVHLLIQLLNHDLNPTVSRIVQQWKGAVSKKAGFPLWQEKFHDRVVDTAEGYRKIQRYIQQNPERWREDRFYPGLGPNSRRDDLRSSETKE